MEQLQRELFLGFWKAHILQQAAHSNVYGLEIIESLARRGHRLSPGTIYPILKRMEQAGWLASSVETVCGKRRRNYTITPAGRSVLRTIRRALSDLHREVVRNRAPMVD
jgi:DNA-binding PadR family transcriptional regulator